LTVHIGIEVSRSMPILKFQVKLLRKNVSRINKKSLYLQICMGTPEGHQKNEKKTKIHIGSIRQSLQAQPKNIKNRNKKNLK
jgi:hypothetical protein